MLHRTVCGTHQGGRQRLPFQGDRWLCCHTSPCLRCCALCCTTHPGLAVPSFPMCPINLTGAGLLPTAPGVGVKVQEVAVPPFPAEQRCNGGGCCAHRWSFCAEQRAARLSLSFHLHSGKLKLEKSMLLLQCVLSVTGNMLSAGELPFMGPFSKFQASAR